jgi:uncharacterized membrane protein YgdD (TMEM256/DUF423 family)
VDDKEWRERLSRLPLAWTAVAYVGAVLYGGSVFVRQLTDATSIANDYARIAREAGGAMLLFWAIFTLVWARKEIE